MINLQSKAWRSTIAAALLFLEGLVSLSLALYLVIQNFIADNVSDRHALLGEIIYALIGSAVLILLAWGFFTNRRFSRAPSVLLNLIFIGISTYMFNEGLLVLGFATILISGATVAAAVSVIPE
jgi:hypothetical protein